MRDASARHPYYSCGSCAAAGGTLPVIMSETTANLNALFTLSSLLSLQGAAAASLLVPNILTYLIGPSFQSYEKWIAFAIAMLLALVTAWIATDTNILKWLVAIFNGFLIFASAAGVNEMATRRPPSAARSFAVRAKPAFFHSWF